MCRGLAPTRKEVFYRRTVAKPQVVYVKPEVRLPKQRPGEPKRIGSSFLVTVTLLMRVNNDTNTKQERMTTTNTLTGDVLAVAPQEREATRSAFL